MTESANIYVCYLNQIQRDNDKQYFRTYLHSLEANSGTGVYNVCVIKSRSVHESMGHQRAIVGRHSLSNEYYDVVTALYQPG